MPSIHGSFKPRPKYEKRLFKPDEKPGKDWKEILSMPVW
jgi:hypothetical protein